MNLPSDFSGFQKTLGSDQPHSDWPDTLTALWYDAKGDWHRAHELVDQLFTPMAKSIHAYLHRKEGDEWNAGYWYRQAGKPFPKKTLVQEFQILVDEAIAQLNTKP